MNTAEIFQAIIDSIHNPLPSVPKAASSSWNKIKEARPCIEAMREAKGITAGIRNSIVYAIAIELFRRGWAADEVMRECMKVNQSAFQRSLPASEVASTVRSAGQRRFLHSCSDDTLKAFCHDFNGCKWRKAARYNEAPVRDSINDFMENWYATLRSQVREVYLYIAELEANRKLAPGSLITQSYRDIAQDLKYKDKGVAIRAAQLLEKLGLIEIIAPAKLIGKSEASGLATRFKRIMPLPMPGMNQLNNKENI